MTGSATPARPEGQAARHAPPLTIVALGDSTTAVADWTDQVDEVYADLLPAALAARGIWAQVHNAGLGDSTTRRTHEMWHAGR